MDVYDGKNEVVDSQTSQMTLVAHVSSPCHDDNEQTVLKLCQNQCNTSKRTETLHGATFDVNCSAVQTIIRDILGTALLY